MSLKITFQNIHIKDLYSDCSINNELNVIKSTGNVLCILLERSVSQNCDLGLDFLLNKYLETQFPPSGSSE